MSTSTAVPVNDSETDCTSQVVSRGVMSTASRVEQVVRVTDSATLSRAMKQTTFDAVPPGQHPTRTSPTTKSMGSLNNFARLKAKNGMTRYCKPTPKRTVPGISRIRTKSCAVSVNPMLSMMMPRKYGIHVG